MNQQHLNDFDQWARKLADDADSPFKESSWNRMEQLLNQKKKRKTWWFWPVGLGIVGLTAITSYFLSTQQKRQNDIVTSDYLTKTQSSPDGMMYSIHKTIEHTLHSQNNLNTFNKDLLLAGPETSSQMENSNLSNPTGSKTRSKDLGATPNHVQTKSNFEQNNKTIRPTNVFSNSKPGSLKEPLKDYDASVGFKESTQPTAAKQKEQNSLERLLESNQSNSVHDIGTPASSDHTASSLIAKNQNSESLRSSLAATGIDSRWNTLNSTRNIQLPPVPGMPSKPAFKKSSSAILFTLQGAPEFTATSNGSFGKLRMEYGFTVGYQLNKHWSLSSGLQKTTKDYVATAADYKIEPGNYLYGKIIHQIDALCDVIQWPISLGYRFRAFGNNYWQVNAGLASLRMDTESYDYSYSYRVGGNVSHKVEKLAIKNWHWMAAASFGISYQKNISKHLIFSINPYYQVPLKGVGEGLINLRSFGNQVGLTYTLPLKK